MSRFRICPWGLTKWKVQKRTLLGWGDMTKSVGEGAYHVCVFDTEFEAENFIDKRLAGYRQMAELEAAERERRRNIVPREYPSP